MTATAQQQIAYAVPRAAQLLDINTKELRALLNSGAIAGYKTRGGGQWRIAHTELMAYVQEQTEAAQS